MLALSPLYIPHFSLLDSTPNVPGLFLLRGRELVEDLLQARLAQAVLLKSQLLLGVREGSKKLAELQILTIDNVGDLEPKMSGPRSEATSGRLLVMQEGGIIAFAVASL